MNGKIVLTALSSVLCLGAVSGVIVQRQQLLNLRAQQGSQAPPSANAQDRPQGDELKATTPGEEALPELLRLRSEVTRLSARKRELAGVAEEAERLRAQLASRQTTESGANQLPPGYIRKAQAQMMGYSTPENTIQTFLWALHHQDINVLLQSFTPPQAEKLRSRIQASPDSAATFFKATEPMPGLGIQSRASKPDGSTELQVTFGPGLLSQTFRLLQINGEWKLDEAFF